MADIDIVRKDRSNLRIWIVLAIVILLALYFIFGRTGATTSSAILGNPSGQPLAVWLALAA